MNISDLTDFYIITVSVFAVARDSSHKYLLYLAHLVISTPSDQHVNYLSRSSAVLFSAQNLPVKYGK